MKKLVTFLFAVGLAFIANAQGPEILNVTVEANVFDNEIFLPVEVDYTTLGTDLVSTLTWTAFPDPGGFGTQTVDLFQPSLQGRVLFYVPLDPYMAGDIIQLDIQVIDDAGMSNQTFPDIPTIQVNAELEAPEFAAVEYFFDVDPGFGEGNALSFPQDGTDFTQVYSIPTTGLTPGDHVLFIRTQDLNGNWSISSFDVFLNQNVMFDDACLDVNNDGTLNVFDLLDLLGLLGSSTALGCEEGDMNQDGTVDIGDLLLFLQFL